MSAADCTNWLVMRQGGLTRRPGTIFIAPLRDESEAGRVVEFEFNVAQAYVLIFNDSYIRFATLGGLVTATPQNITGITKANPAVVTYAGSDTYANGDRVWISGVVGMVEVNNREFTVANVDTGANTFELSGVNSTSYTTYSSGGSVAEIYEVASPYAAADIFDLQFAQSGDTVYISHPDYAPRTLVRSSETSWALSTFTPEDGPYLDEDTGDVTMTPADTGSAVPLMTNNTTPSGTAADSAASANAYKVFDRDPTSVLTINAVVGNVSYDYAGAATKIVDAYWLQATQTVGDLNETPTSWTFEGYDGTNWVVLDTRTEETGWGQGERRYYEFVNTTGFQSYRLKWIGVDGSTTDSTIAGLYLHQAASEQTAFNLTASAVTKINAGAGFKSTDVGRSIRLLGSDGVWRWASIVAYTSTTVVTIRIYGHALPDVSIIKRWKLSAWSVDDGYPTAVGFYSDRLGFGGSDTAPLDVWFSQSSDYENFGTSDPILDTDGISVRMTGGQLNRIAFMEELQQVMAVGTAGTMRVIGPTDGGEPFSPSNVQQKRQTADGASSIQPVLAGENMLYVDRYTMHVHEFSYNWQANGYTTAELSILSDHLFRPGIVECATQMSGEDDFQWYVMSDGTLVCITYDQSQRIVGITPIEIAGGGTSNAVVESVAGIPSDAGDVLYLVVKRTINGSTRRYVEYLAPHYQTGDDLDDAVYLDGALTYDGSAVSSISGATHLIGESIGVFADGVDIGDATVSATGGVTLPSGTGSVITIGKRFTSRLETLRAPQIEAKDGSPFGRRVVISEMGVDLLNTAGLRAGTLELTRAIPKGATAGELQTGMFEVFARDKHKNSGVMVAETDKAYPATIRAVQVTLESEP